MKPMRKSARPIPGWFSLTDQILFSYFLEKPEQRGDLLEIGVYLGKSSVFIEKFRSLEEELHVCDLFESETDDLENMHEIDKSYDSLSLENFKKNFLSLHNSLPVIHNCNSSELSNKLSGKQFRFIHIDGSHLYQYVSEDIQFSLKSIYESSGVIVVDDYRSAHTPGVAAAIWAQVSQGNLRLLLVSGYKAYLAMPNTVYQISKIEQDLLNQNLRVERFSIYETESLRIISDEKKDFPNNHPIIRMVCPPIFLKLIGKG